MASMLPSNLLSLSLDGISGVGVDTFISFASGSVGLRNGLFTRWTRELLLIFLVRVRHGQSCEVQSDVVVVSEAVRS